LENFLRISIEKSGCESIFHCGESQPTCHSPFCNIFAISFWRLCHGAIAQYKIGAGSETYTAGHLLPNSQGALR
jgi:hypothetical protein